MRSALIPLVAAVACGGSAGPGPESAAGAGGHPAGDPEPPASHGPPSPRPDGLVLGTIDGAATRFDDHRAPVTVVALWASFCAPCVRELPLIEALHQAYADRQDVTVLLVSIDDFAASQRQKVARIAAEASVTVPVFIDHKRALIERVAPRDARGKAHYTVPMLVVIDEQFRLRRLLDVDPSAGEAPFLSRVSPLVDAALRGEPPPPEEPYQPPLGSGYTRRSITLTVPENLGEHQIIHYLRQFEDQIREMYPDLDEHQMDEVMDDIEAKLHTGGTFEIEIPHGH